MIHIIHNIFRSKDFRPAFAELAGIRALVPPNTPLMACTATATSSIREQVVSTLEMFDHVDVCLSPNRSNIMYHARRKSTVDGDFAQLLSTLKEKLVLTPRVVVYCNTLLTCAHLFEYFSYEMEVGQYYPPGTLEISDNRLFGMFHAKTPQHSKDNIIRSLQDPNGVVRIIFASVAIGMGVDLQGVNIIVHYGAPSSIEDYFQVNMMLYLTYNAHTTYLS